GWTAGRRPRGLGWPPNMVRARVPALRLLSGDQPWHRIYAMSLVQASERWRSPAAIQVAAHGGLAKPQAAPGQALAAELVGMVVNPAFGRVEELGNLLGGKPAVRPRVRR